MTKFRTLTGIITTLLSCPAIASSLHGNLNPFVQHAALMSYQDRASKTWEIDTEISLTNEYQIERSANEELTLDYEQLRLDLNGQYQLNPRWALKIHSTFYSQSGGFGDAIIDGYHTSLSLPENGRDLAPRDGFAIRYQRNGQTLVQSAKGSGLGKLALGVSRRYDNGMAMHFMIKLPSGNHHRFIGSQSFAASTAVSQQWQVKEYGQIYVQFGLSIIDRSGPLSSLQKPWVATLSSGWNWPLFQNIGLNLQIDLNSASHRDTSLKTLQASAGTLSLALQSTNLSGRQWQLGFREDIIRGQGSPDFGIYIRHAVNF